jgi:hypothetical protein
MILMLSLALVPFVYDHYAMMKLPRPNGIRPLVWPQL